MRKQTKLWTTKSGEKIRICDMTDKHLNNAIDCLKRYSVAKREQAIASCAVVCRTATAEMASYYADQDFDRAAFSTNEDFLPRIYYSLTAERKRREKEELSD